MNEINCTNCKDDTDIFYKVFNETDFNISIGTDLTLYGVLKDSKMWEDISKHWKAYTTKVTYLTKIKKYIIPGINNLPLKDCTRKKFDDLINAMKKIRKTEGKDTTPTYVHNTKCILARITKVAELFEICPDVLWGTQYDIPETIDEEKTLEKLAILPKSLLPEEEIIISRAVLEDETQEGKYFGVALMFCLGLRDNEAVALTFEDIHPIEGHPNAYAAWIYKSSDRGTRATKYGGKTNNMPRIIPIPDKLSALIKARRKWVRANAKSGTHIERYPIACLSNKKLNKQCTPREISELGTTILRRAKINEEMLSLLDNELSKLKCSDGTIEKDATSYLFRRNFGTHLKILGLNKVQRQYLMGHDIEDQNSYRSMYRNDEELYNIARLMHERPIVNKSYTNSIEMKDQLYNPNLYNAKITIPIEAGITQLHLTVNQNEPNTKTEVQLKSNADTVNGTYYTYDNNRPYSIDTQNILAVYHDRYDAAIKKYQDRTDNELITN